MSPDWTKIKQKTLYQTVLEARQTKPKVERDHPGKDWATIWKRTLCTKLTNKQITLNFEIVHSVLPTGNRSRKQSQDPGTCPHCSQIEKIKHLFTECSVVKPVGMWLSSYLSGLNHSTTIADEDTIIYSLFRAPPSKQKSKKLWWGPCPIFACRCGWLETRLNLTTSRPHRLHLSIN